MIIKDLIFKNTEWQMIRLVEINGEDYKRPFGESNTNWEKIIGTDLINSIVISYNFYGNNTLYIKK